MIKYGLSLTVSAINAHKVAFICQNKDTFFGFMITAIIFTMITEIQKNKG